MSAYKVIDCLIFQPKHMFWVLKRTVSMRRFFKASNYRLNLICKKILRFYAQKLCLSRLSFIQYADMIHLSAQVKLVDLRTLQVIVKSK